MTLLSRRESLEPGGDSCQGRAKVVMNRQPRAARRGDSAEARTCHQRRHCRRRQKERPHPWYSGWQVCLIAASLLLPPPFLLQRWPGWPRPPYSSSSSAQVRRGWNLFVWKLHGRSTFFFFFLKRKQVAKNFSSPRYSSRAGVDWSSSSDANVNGPLLSILFGNGGREREMWMYSERRRLGIDFQD